MVNQRIPRRLFVSYLGLIVVCLGLALSLSPREEAVVRGVLIGGLVAATVGALLSVTVARRFSSTIETLTHAVDRIAAGEPVRAADLRGASGGDDELDALAAALGELSSRLSDERKNLHAENLRLRTVLDGMSEGVALLTDDRIAFANPAFTRLLDLSGNVEGRTPLEAVRRLDLAGPLTAAGSGAVLEPRDITLPSGRVLQLSTAPLSTGAAVVVLLDVTVARSLERMRREFVANASHELRTPVAAIRAVAETIASSPDMAHADRARFERILSNHAGRLSRLVNDLLDLSRAEATRPAIEAVDLRVPLESALAAVRERAEARHLHIQHFVPLDLPAVAADPAAIEDVLVNLLDNAVKYSPDRGRIQVRATVEGPGGPRFVRIEVEDSGFGIPAEHLPRIFERFYRVDHARTREVGGTGLGLAIVKHLVQSHGGEVSVSSTMGKGTTIRVSFPIMQAPAMAAT